jgi:hypothetical protein
LFLIYHGNNGNKEGDEYFSMRINSKEIYLREILNIWKPKTFKHLFFGSG